jgi:stigma-specific protein Stig1
VSEETTNRSFDELARALASGSLSRRKVLRLMGGLLVGSALGSLPGVAWANDDDDRCSEGQTHCGERCVNLRTNERHCGSCFNRCRSTQTCCGGRCVNLQRNERHCGRCFNRCEEGSECVVGECVFRSCTQPFVTCGLSSDLVNPCICRTEANTGQLFCGEPVHLACSRSCTSTSDCPTGTRCQEGDTGCVAECGTDPDVACQ